jgi:hypothetical protein
VAMASGVRDMDAGLFGSEENWRRILRRKAIASSHDFAACGIGIHRRRSFRLIAVMRINLLKSLAYFQIANSTGG